MANEQTSRTSHQPTAHATTGMPGPGGRGRRARIEKARDARGALRRLLATLRPYKWALVGAFILAAASTGLDLLAPFLMGVAIDEFIAAGDRGGLQRLVLLMAGAYLGM